ncbi:MULTISPECIES: AAA family ATPase [Helicobacter]|uniref:AAA family ATPase n=2 Tax=Helicobacter TaxID=209 RepID=A0A377JLR1_9HELI|nr:MULTISPECIES: AAA family ATPase [Helicobacter]KAA8708155.1 AAA family ATPase [Helicobacter canis]MDL0080991.1 AAA family ATPase [Helicobacter sp. CPD2-1]MDL0082985.1 AAA family ATPase [Helicobacter sp. XJK30-2]STP06486.1 partitioning protein ParA [Helicobacter canis]
MIVSIVNEKGGSGKTTLAVNIACKLAQEGDEVLLVDADPQRSTEAFLNIRTNENLPLLFNSVTKLGDGLAREVKSLSQKYDSLVIDTGGRDSKEMRQALAIADIIIIPSVPSQYDVVVLDKMISLYDEVSAINPESRALIVIDKASPNPFLEKKISDLRSYINEKNLENLHLMNSIIYEREAYKNATSAGMGITEFCKGGEKAFDDFVRFYDELIEYIKSI